MHLNVLVVGDVIQMDALKTAGWCRWWTIGGRFSGRLPLKPDRTGATFGGKNFVPPIERMLRDQLDFAAEQQRHDRPGVDQATKAEVDLDELAPAALVINGELIETGISPQSQAILTAMHLPQATAEDEDLQQAHRELEAWDAEIQRRLAAVPNDAVLTVVDVRR